MSLGWKDLGIRKSEFVTKTQFLYPEKILQANHEFKPTQK